ncbi:hypothetical protein CFE70_010028 [Pyrenophora teres f. teres 0-1]
MAPHPFDLRCYGAGRSSRRYELRESSASVANDRTTAGLRHRPNLMTRLNRKLRHAGLRSNRRGCHTLPALLADDEHMAEARQPVWLAHERWNFVEPLSINTKGMTILICRHTAPHASAQLKSEANARYKRHTNLALNAF